MAPNPIHVAIDVGPAVHQRAGLSRYTERLIAHLLHEQAEAVALTLVYNAHSGHTLPETLQGAPVQRFPLNQYGWRLSALATQLGRHHGWERHLPPGQLYHATEHLLPALRRPTVLTVHDLIFERFPQHHTWRNRLFLQLAMPRFVRAATAIIAVSEQTRRDLIEIYRTPPHKIHVIYQGIDRHFAPAPIEQVRRVQAHYSPGPGEASRPYLLMVGTLEPRKNHALVLRALARLKANSQPHRLLVVGGAGWLFEPVERLVAELGLQQDVTFAGYVPLSYLPALYTGAACFLQPSLYEGFGFPVAEALACGAPVVCSNSSSLPEVAGDAALLVSPQDDQALAAAITRLGNEPGLAAALRTRGLQQAANFRWLCCAAETVDVYRSLACSVDR